MTKLVENAFRDVNIAFANELSIVSDQMGLDVWEVIRLANRHPRVNILQPGPGVGGHCIAVDPWFIVHGAPDHTPLIRTAREVNDGKIDHVVRQAKSLIEAHPATKIGLLGLAFKANIDDFRESPAKKVAIALAREFGSRDRGRRTLYRHAAKGFRGHWSQLGGRRHRAARMRHPDRSGRS